MYTYIFNLGIDKGEITYIYLEELTYIYLLFHWLFFLFLSEKVFQNVQTAVKRNRAYWNWNWQD